GPVLNVQILGEIAEFERYDCIVWTSQSVFMKFYVRYNNDLKGYVYGSSFILGIVSSELYLLKLYCKIGIAKSLLGKEEWDYPVALLLEGSFICSCTKGVLLVFIVIPTRSKIVGSRI
ncbi:hypothetical protein N7491_006309, partial [Penicillium cf. griseofulvum]